MTEEKLASKFHDIYQQEARRQGDVRHKDKYEDLPENIKEFDRVLAQYVLANFIPKALIEGKVSDEWLHKQAIIFSAISPPAYYDDYVKKLKKCLQGFLDDYRKEMMK